MSFCALPALLIAVMFSISIFQDSSDLLLFKHITILNAESLQHYSLVGDCCLDSILSLAGSLCPICSACYLAVGKQEDGRN